MPLIKRLLIAFPLSILITLALLIAYALFPLVSAMLRETSRGPDTGGVAAVTGGIGVRSTSLLIVEPIVFVFIFLLLSRNKAS